MRHISTLAKAQHLEICYSNPTIELLSFPLVPLQCNFCGRLQYQDTRKMKEQLKSNSLLCTQFLPDTKTRNGH